MMDAEQEALNNLERKLEELHRLVRERNAQMEALIRNRDQWFRVGITSTFLLAFVFGM